MIPNKIVDKVVAGIHRQEWLEGDVAVVAVITRNNNNDVNVSYLLSDMIILRRSYLLTHLIIAVFILTLLLLALLPYPPEYIYQLFC